MFHVMFHNKLVSACFMWNLEHTGYKTHVMKADWKSRLVCVSNKEWELDKWSSAHIDADMCLLWQACLTPLFIALQSDFN